MLFMFWVFFFKSRAAVIYLEVFLHAGTAEAVAEVI